MTLSNSHIGLTFDRRSLRIRSIRNELTEMEVCNGGAQSVLVRMPDEVSDPTFLTQVGSVRSVGGGVRWTLTDERAECRAVLNAVPDENGVKFRIDVTAPRPLWMVEWQIESLKLDEVIIPALGGQSLTKAMPVGTTQSYKYPFWWNAQFIIGAQRRGGVWLETKDGDPAFKLLRVKRTREGFSLTLGFEANAPLTSKSLSAEWYVKSYAHDWRTPVDEHRRWMEKQFGLTPLLTNKHFPSWARSINAVLEVWGMRKDRPEPHHTFEQIVHRINDWKAIHPPERTLLYLPGFAEHGIDSRAPNYDPSPHLGGPKAFKRLVDTAHGLGYRVMIHTNVLAMAFTHPLYARMKRHQVVDVFGRPQYWGLDMDGDWLTEPYFAYINPGARGWGNLIEHTIGKLVRRYHIDGVFLDQTLLAFNVSRGPNFLNGMRRHIQRLQRSFPNVLFAGEGLHEHVVGALPMAQIHGIDSVAEVHGLDGIAGWRNVHPVSTYLFGKYTRFVGHLLTRHPSHAMFRFQEDAYAQLGVLPVASFYDTNERMDIPAVRRMLKRASTM
jgi:hypothetical protein